MAEQRMLDKLKALEIHYEDVQSRLADPAVYADRETLRSLSREEKELSPLIEVWRTLQERQRDLEAAQELSSEPDFQTSAREEIAAALSDIEQLWEKINFCCCPRIPTMCAMWLWRSGPVPEVRRQHCLRILCCGCTPCML